MKPNELMIRDWVANPINGKPMRVMSLTRDVELGLSGFYDEVDPIPLTAEILEKNGFSHIMYSDAYYSIMIGDTYVELRKYENMAVWFNWKENNDGVYADYILPIPEFIHQLQHALRLCGIYKEIEL
jgi:hypothetical protein